MKQLTLDFALPPASVITLAIPQAQLREHHTLLAVFKGSRT